MPPEFQARIFGPAMEATQRTLGEETYRRAHAEGYAMDIDAAVAYVLKDAQ